MSHKYVFVPLGKFDVSKLSFSEPIVKKYGNGTSTTNSQVIYTDESGKKGTPCFQLAEQLSFGPTPQHKYNCKDEEKIPENVQKWNILYNLTSMQTIHDPTDEEKYVIDLFDVCYSKSADYIKNIYQTEKQRRKDENDKTGKNSTIPAPAYSAISTAVSDDDIETAIKFPYKRSFVREKDGKEIPSSATFDLMTYGKGLNIKITTTFYGPGDKKENPEKYHGVRGKFKPVVVFESIYWGSHGTTSYGCSLKFKVYDATYTPSTGYTQERMSETNTEQEIESIDLSNFNYDDSHLKETEDDDIQALLNAKTPISEDDSESEDEKPVKKSIVKKKLALKKK